MKKIIPGDTAGEEMFELEEFVEYFLRRESVVQDESTERGGENFVTLQNFSRNSGALIGLWKFFLCGIMKIRHISCHFRTIFCNWKFCNLLNYSVQKFAPCQRSQYSAVEQDTALLLPSNIQEHFTFFYSFHILFYAQDFFVFTALFVHCSAFFTGSTFTQLYSYSSVTSDSDLVVFCLFFAAQIRLLYLYFIDLCL